MNLIDKKLKDKLKLFENIDKQLGTDCPRVKTKARINDKTPKKEKGSSEQFDKIYSNFLLNNSQFQQPSRTYKPSPVKTPKKTQRSSVKTTCTSKRTSVGHTRSTSQTNLTKLTPPNDSGDRLYNYGFYIKNKLEQKRQLEFEKLHRQMTPKILPKSKSIYRNNNFEQRLYYQSNNESSESIYRKRSHSKDSTVKYDYKPRLDAKSLKIANQLEPSSSRLLKKKKRYKPNESKESFYTVSPSPSATRTNRENIKRLNELYEKGMENMYKREKMYQEQKMKEEEEYKKYSFQPTITKNSPIIDSNSVIRSTPKSSKGASDEMYKKQCEWKKKLENENIKKRERMENIKNRDCTFKPEISHLNIKNDEKFIMRNIEQMNDYVNKRREVIQKNKEYEEYKNRRLGKNVNFTIKPTIPKTFEFNTEKRSHSRSKSGSKRRNDNLNNINPKRTELKTYNFFNDGVYVRNGDEEQDFIQAVNALHCRIDNLNL